MGTPSTMDYSEEQYLAELCRNIKRIRKTKGLTQRQVADHCEMEESGYRRIENGGTNPTFKTLVKISKALGIEIVELMDFPKLMES